MRKLFMIIVTSLAFTGAACAAVNINSATQAELQTLTGVTAIKVKAN